MKFSQQETINIIQHRDNGSFYFPCSKKHVYSLGYIHCCLRILIENNSKELCRTYKDPILKSIIGNPLIIDMDKLESNISSAQKQQTRKSLDFYFVINDGNDYLGVLGDLKLNKKSVVNPYKELEDKKNNSKLNANSFSIPINDKIYIVYPDFLMEELRSVLNRKNVEDPDIGNDFEFISLRDFIKDFFI
jgi:hypothetical protein|nr:hypothetical protein [uncultured Haemophilus sp.]